MWLLVLVTLSCGFSGFTFSSGLRFLRRFRGRSFGFTLFASVCSKGAGIFSIGGRSEDTWLLEALFLMGGRSPPDVLHRGRILPAVAGCGQRRSRREVRVHRDNIVSKELY